MSSDVVVQRRNNQIQDAIDGQNFKQALQLCEKRLKKGENTPFLRAWKAHILFRHADDAHRQRGLKETIELCNSEPPVSDIDALDMLHQTLKRIGGHDDTVRTIWERAAKAKPQKIELHTRWFNHASEGCDWKNAQKAAMSLQNNFPKNRNYLFWAIFMCYLITIDPDNSEADRKLFGTLAYRMISKAASTVPTNPNELLSQPRAIQTSEELSLLIKIFEFQDRYGEVVTLLNSGNMGVDSRIAQGDWSFVRAKASNLEKAGLFEEGVSYARELLSLPDETGENGNTAGIQERDDWCVWKLLLSATEKLGKPETVKETQDFIQDFIRRQPRSRNAQLASLDLTQYQVTNGSQTKEDLLAACQTYFDANCNKLYCFDDLQKYLADFDSETLGAFHKHISNNEKVRGGQNNSEEADSPFKGVAEINALKLEYCFQLHFTEDSGSQKHIADFISRCLRAYRNSNPPEPAPSQSAIESQPRDDLCLLAAMSLIRLGEVGVEGGMSKSPNTALIRAAAVLEHLLVKSPHNYQALLLLVRVFLLLGAGSLALRAFFKLSVKQMQYETVAHNLFTRLSTIHPHTASPVEGLEQKDANPRTSFTNAMNFYRNSETATTYSRATGLDHGSYSSVEGSIELHKSLKHSIGRKMWALETRRIQRLVGNEPLHYDHLVSDNVSTVDKRNFDGFMNCEAPGKPSFEEHVRLGPLPRTKWVKSMTATDRLFMFLYGSRSQKKGTAAVDPSILDDVIDNGSDGESNTEAELTAAELESSKIHQSLLRAVSIIAGSNKPTPEATADLDSIFSQLEKWLTDKNESPSNTESYAFKDTIHLKDKPLAPSWVYLHNNFTLLETLKAISLFAYYASGAAKGKSPLGKEKAESIQSLVKQAGDRVRANTRLLKSHISESGVLGELVDLVLADREAEGSVGAEMAEMVDTVALEVFCGEVMESWEDALNGVLNVIVVG
ncbi:hypothetical protein FQN54_007373 [Arachnomyces sp. PD_36]|nr:hypothetical protein FQN54_007373 [Arachnomyces sp. PD_36]